MNLQINKVTRSTKLFVLIFFFLVIVLLSVSGCSNNSEITGKGVFNAQDKGISEKISECVKSCDDGSQSPEEFLNSCTKILQYGGEKVFNNYVETCKK